MPNLDTFTKSRYSHNSYLISLLTNIKNFTIDNITFLLLHNILRADFLFTIY